MFSAFYDCFCQMTLIKLDLIGFQRACPAPLMPVSELEGDRQSADSSHTEGEPESWRGFTAMGADPAWGGHVASQALCGCPQGLHTLQSEPDSFRVEFW